jgi:hypothetical protein
MAIPISEMLSIVRHNSACKYKLCQLVACIRTVIGSVSDMQLNYVLGSSSSKKQFIYCSLGRLFILNGVSPPLRMN